MLAFVTFYCSVMNRVQFNVYHHEKGGSVTELQWLEFSVTLSCKIFNNQSNYSAIHGEIHGQRV